MMTFHPAWPWRKILRERLQDIRMNEASNLNFWALKAGTKNETKELHEEAMMPWFFFLQRLPNPSCIKSHISFGLTSVYWLSLCILIATLERIPHLTGNQFSSSVPRYALSDFELDLWSSIVALVQFLRLKEKVKSEFTHGSIHWSRLTIDLIRYTAHQSMNGSCREQPSSLSKSLGTYVEMVINFGYFEFSS